MTDTMLFYLTAMLAIFVLSILAGWEAATFTPPDGKNRVIRKWIRIAAYILMIITISTFMEMRN